MLHHFGTGLMTLIAAKAFGTTRLLIKDVNPTNLARAEKMAQRVTVTAAQPPQLTLLRS